MVHFIIKQVSPGKRVTLDLLQRLRYYYKVIPWRRIIGATPTAVQLEPEIKERLMRLAAIKKRSPHWLMKEALREYSEKEEFAEKLRQETLERWETYKVGGEGFDNESITAWLDSWGTGNESERPVCEK